jgi:hypothetical protein
VKGFKTTVLLEDAAFTGVNRSFGTLQVGLRNDDGEEAVNHTSVTI